MLNNGAIKNRTIFCHNNLEILQGIDSDCIDLIYLDPPFNKKKTFTAPTGSPAEGASFSDIFREKDIKDEWLQDIKEDYFSIHNLLTAVRAIEGRTSYNFCYLAYMAIRLIECQRVLKPTGSLYLHCDQTMSHYLKLLLDCIFGEKNFRNEIAWWYGGGGASQKNWAKKHDIILYYSKTEDLIFNTDAVREDYKWDKGQRRADGSARDLKKGKLPDNVFQLHGIMPWAKERTGYPTQKPLVLLERIIAASSPVGGVVLDPFCGCATTCVAAERLGRCWVGVDISIKAFDLVKDRMREEMEGSFFTEDLLEFKTDPPKRTDMGADTRVQKYVYIISNAQYKNYFKVGSASDPDHRLNSYQTSNPKRGYVLEYTHLTPDFRAMESYIHDLYKSPHEWVFEPDMQKIIKEIEGCTCLLSVSCQYLALDGVYHPLWAAFPNNPTL